MDSFESRMNPRFLAESEKGMLWEPRVIESGRGPVEGFKEDEKGKRRASVLSSLSLSWFSVIHVFMLSVHALSSLVRLVTSLRGADFWSCVSSAKSWWFTEWLAMISERGVVYWTKRMGPSTEPWGTPYMSCDGDEDELLTEVDWYLSERYEWNHWSAVDWMPKTEFRRERRIWWSVVLKAAERSKRNAYFLEFLQKLGVPDLVVGSRNVEKKEDKRTFLFPNALPTCSPSFTRWSVTPRPHRKPAWHAGKTFLDSQKYSRRCLTTLSNTFPRWEVREMGR